MVMTQTGEMQQLLDYTLGKQALNANPKSRDYVVKFVDDEIGLREEAEGYDSENSYDSEKSAKQFGVRLNKQHAIALATSGVKSYYETSIWPIHDEDGSKTFFGWWCSFSLYFGTLLLMIGIMWGTGLWSKAVVSYHQAFGTEQKSGVMVVPGGGGAAGMTAPLSTSCASSRSLGADELASAAGGRYAPEVTVVDQEECAD
jgi:hypothetical protein